MWRAWVVVVAVVGGGCAGVVAKPEEAVFVDGEEVREGDRERVSDGEEVFEEEYFYGVLEWRARGVFEEMRGEFEDCVGAMGAREQVRELAVEVVKPSMDAQFEVGRVVVSVDREEVGAKEGGCALELAKEYVGAVGSSVFDGFERYILAVIVRPERSGGCEEGEGVVCVELEGISACGDEEGAAVERAISKGRDENRCMDPRNYREEALLNDPLLSRAVVLSELIVWEGRGQVVFEANQEWASGLARCLASSLGEVEVLAGMGSGDCRRSLRNQGVTYSGEPVFTFVLK